MVMLTDYREGVSAEPVREEEEKEGKNLTVFNN